jgi:hypothetical protein
MGGASRGRINGDIDTDAQNHACRCKPLYSSPVVDKIPTKSRKLKTVPFLIYLSYEVNCGNYSINNKYNFHKKIVNII